MSKHIFVLFWHTTDHATHVYNMQSVFMTGPG